MLLRSPTDSRSFIGFTVNHRRSMRHGVRRCSGPDVETATVDLSSSALQRGLASRPSGAATVKELYGSGTELLGWSVMVKVEDDSGKAPHAAQMLCRVSARVLSGPMRLQI